MSDRYTPVPQVDDLDDIGALEEYIGRSQMVLFFLSKGYFRSKAIMPPRTPLNGHSYDPQSIWPITRSGACAELSSRGPLVALDAQAAGPRARGAPGQGRDAGGAASGMS